MAKRTIAQKRQLALNNMVRDYNIPEDVARNLMNRFYRLCGALDRLIVLKNDARTANLRWVQKLSETTDKRNDKLNAEFKNYGLELIYFGYLPTICPLGKNSSSEAVPTFFY